MTLEIKTLEAHPQGKDQIKRLSQQAWPEFLRNADDVHWGELETQFGNFQILFTMGNQLAAVGHTVPFHWDGKFDSLPQTIEGLILAAMDCIKTGQDPNNLAALAVMIDPAFRGQGLSPKVLAAMKKLGAAQGLSSLVVPVRPTLKSRYPITPFEKYVTWKRDDGAPFDPWLRVHHRLGGKVLGITHRALTVDAPVDRWQKWAQMAFPATGEYVVDGALQPITINREENWGRYRDPNLWFQHAIDPDT